MFVGFSFGATVHGFGGAFTAFAEAFLFGGMAAATFFQVGGWIGDGATAEEMSDEGDKILVKKMYTSEMCVTDRRLPRPKKLFVPNS
jgi:hypothetical protein